MKSIPFKIESFQDNRDVEEILEEKVLVWFEEQKKEFIERTKEEVEIVLLEELQILRENELHNIKKGDTGEQGIKGDKGEKGDNGKDGTKGIQGDNGKDGSNGIDGKKGKDGLNGKDGSKGKDGKDGKNGKDAVIKNLQISDILDLEKELENIKKAIERKQKGIKVGGGGDVVAFHDLSSQTNGVLKTFTVPKGRKIVVFSSDFPAVLMENNGFTMDGTRTSLTLTTVNAPSSGSQLLYQYTK